MTTSQTPGGDPLNDLSRHLDAYLAAVLEGDRRVDIDVALALVDRGVPAERLITGFLRPAQVAIGTGWQEGKWGVALEHRASAITESALQAVTEVALRTPGAIPEGSRGRAVVACSEGEWHVLPGRMGAEILRLRGLDALLIGPSVPADDLAAMLGADLLLEALEAPPASPRGSIPSAEAAEEIRVITRDRGSFVEAATSTALSACPHLRVADAAVRATREDLDSTLRALSAATIASDADVVTDFAAWFEGLLAARDLPVSFCSTAFDLLLDVLPPELPITRGMADAALQACTAPPMAR